MAVANAHEATFLGHPRGLLYLSFTEGWERFSFYGMRALLVLYMVEELLLPGHIENVAGIGPYRNALESMFGPMSTQALASQTFGLYAGLVYLTPIFGGYLADRWLGLRKTVLLGIGLMTAGHFFMAMEWSVLLALLLLILGSGCLKGNIATQVGRIYASGQEELCARGYTIFSTGINIGAMIGPLVCGLVAQLWGWHYGFGLAGVFMLLAAAVYIAGLRHLPPDRPRGRAREVHAPLTGGEWKMVALVLFVLLLSLPQTMGWDMQMNTGFIFLSERVDLATPLGSIPEAWFASEDALASILIVPVLMWLWRWQDLRGSQWSDLGKIAFGGVLQALALACLAVGDLAAGSGKVAIVYPVLAFFLSGCGFMFYWPVILALVSRISPVKIASMLMAFAYAQSFVSGVGTGWLARYYETMENWQFWSGWAAFVLAGCAVILLVRGPVTRTIVRAQDQASIAG